MAAMLGTSMCKIRRLGYLGKIDNLLTHFRSSSGLFYPAEFHVTLSRVYFSLITRSFNFCWFSHDVTKIQTLELLILLGFYFHNV